MVSFHLFLLQPVKPEKVVNPYGSAAGAGSGEFHVYRHARSRELERMQTLQESEEEAKKDGEFRKLLEKNRQEDTERTEKLRKKRQRQKEAKQRKKNLAKVGVVLTTGFEEEEEEDFAYEPSVAAPGEAAVGPEPGDEHTEHGNSKLPGDDRSATIAKPTEQDESIIPPRDDDKKEPAKSASGGTDVPHNNDEEGDDDDDDDDESVGPQPQPKRSKSEE
jgi:Protein of unknown function (DUF1168)